MNNLQNTKKWLKTWDRAALALRTQKQQELAAHDYYEKTLAILDGMLNYAASHPSENRVCGLVEQQYLFKKLFSRLCEHADDA